MNKQLRKAVIAGNWKMNKTPSETTQLIEEIKPLVAMPPAMLYMCPLYRLARRIRSNQRKQY